MSRGRRYNLPSLTHRLPRELPFPWPPMAEMGDSSDQRPSSSGMEVGVEEELGENGQDLTAERMPTMAAPTAIEKIVSATSLKGWWSAAQGFVSPDFSRLHWEVVGFCKANELSAEQVKSRADALAHIESVVHDIWPKAEVHLFGSVATGLALPWSDIDVTILPFGHENGSWRKPSAESWLTPLSRNMGRRGQCKFMRKILAKVPLLKIVLKSGIACDISFDEASGLQSMAIVQQFMKQYPALRPLCLVLKFFLGQQKLNELHTGGLSSFSIVIMVTAHLQKLGPNAGPAGHDLGILLFSFFAYYTTFHNYRSSVVSARECPSHNKQRRCWYNAKHAERLAVEDPLDSFSNLCKGTNRSEEVRWTFRQAYGLLLVNWQQKNVLSQLISPVANPNHRPGPSKAGKFQSSSPTPQREKKRPRWYREGVELPLTKALQRHLQRSGGVVTGKQLEKTRSDVVERSSLLDRLRIVQNELKGSGQSVQAVHSDGHCKSREKAAVAQFLEMPQTTLIPSEKSRKRYFSEIATGNESEDFKESTLFEQPEQPCDLFGRSRDERTVVDFWERNLSRGPRTVSLPKVSAMHCAHLQPVQKFPQESEGIGEGRMPRFSVSTESGDSAGVEEKCRQLALDVHSGLSPGTASLSDVQNDFQQGDLLGVPLTASKLSSLYIGNVGQDEATQAMEACQSQPGGDVVEGHNESLLADFWEEQLSRRSKSKKRAVQQHVNDNRKIFCDEAEVIHAEQSPEAGDAMGQVESDLAVTPLSVSRSASMLTDNGGQDENTPPVKTHQPLQVMDVDRGINEGLLVDFWEEQLIRRPKPKNGSVAHRAIGVVQVTHPEDIPQGGDAVSKLQSDSLTAVLGKSPMTPLNVSSLQIGHGGQDEETLPMQNCTPEQEMDVDPKSTDEVLLLSFWEEQSAKKPKKRALTQHANGDEENLQTAQITQRQNRPLQKSPDEMMLSDFWETHLTPGLKGKKVPSTEHASKNDEHSQQLQSSHLQKPQSCNVMSEKSEDEKLLTDFWVTHLAGRPKGRKISLTSEVL